MQTLVKVEDLRVGQSMRFLGTWKRITGFRPHTGPLPEAFGIAEWATSKSGITLCRGECFEVDAIATTGVRCGDMLDPDAKMRAAQS